MINEIGFTRYNVRVLTDMAIRLFKNGELEPNEIKAVRDEEGTTVLWWTSCEGDNVIIKLLKEAGAKE